MPKLCVYAICRNESRFVYRWMASMSEADGVYVLDTGSDDDTAALLRKCGAYVETQQITPWRFDTARNRSLELVPADADLCICTDLDEVFHPGWRAELEKAFRSDVPQYRYRYTWSFLPDGREGVVFYAEKIHARHGFHWVSPVHETLRYEGQQPYRCVLVPGVQLDHHPDNAKSRAQYLPLLELAVREEPQNDRNMHYLGREYMYRRMWRECEETLKRHLKMPSAVWPDERSASMRYLARAAQQQSRPDEAERWLLRAAAEAPHLREPWLALSQFEAERHAWAGSLFFAQRALHITQRSESYINEAESWGAKPFDLAAVAAYYLHQYAAALSYGMQASAYAPHDPRLTSNLVYYRSAAERADK